MSKDYENGIQVGVETEYLATQSRPETSHYVFAYTVTIRNVSQQRARLLTRHWVITDADGKVQEVQGEGVVGETPWLSPGEQFRYSSGTFLSTPVGSMHGSYGMIGEDGASFSAPIAPFSLAVPRMVH